MEATEHKHTALTAVHAVQYVWSIIGLLFVACAIDTYILVPGMTADEKALAASSVVAVIAVLYHFLTSPKKVIFLAVDATMAIFLFSIFVYGVYNTTNKHGACSSPKNMGVWDNTRGCTRMTIAAAFFAFNFVTFAVSTALVALLELL